MQFFLIFALLMLFFQVQLGEAQSVDSEHGITPLQQPSDLDAGKVALGKQLFTETRLSKDGSISCAHCHLLEAGGADGLKFSFGVNGAEGKINTPTVYNAGLNRAQFWDGRAETLEEQIDGPIHNPLEMASNWPHIVSELQADAVYRKLFTILYGEAGLTANHVKDAIAEFERSLVSVKSPFDRYLQGDDDAITAEAKQGYQLFSSYGCISCHQGANVGGNLFQKFGIFGDYFKDRGNITAADRGRQAVTGRARDLHRFKVPSLRLVSMTPPYFHDGSANTLPEAIRVMAKYQLGRTIADEDIALIVAFLSSLAGEMVESTQ
ncbi:MAG: cytochrome c peroxidase [Mariprofundus sp.]|nr:cytochrome c peroxidase [Mariprofundus sp.]